MVEMVEILDGRLGKCSVERVRYVIKDRCKIWILDSGLDYGLDRGLDGGLDFGPKFGPSFGLVITACFV